jgi:predicted CXXCH cytochrome family protein
MLHTTIISGTKKSMAAVLFVITALANAGAAFAERENCQLVKQLEDPIERQMFRSRLNIALQASTSQYGEYYADQPVTIVKDGESYEVDSFSFGCLSCHDGTNSPGHDIDFKNSGRSDFSGSNRRSHPIGMHYGSASYVNNQLQRLENLNPNMILIDGRVGCLTCHNPFNRQSPHLAVTMDRSNLCFSCHLK